MRLIKMFALAAISVGAVMAFIGASSAMATELEEVVVCHEDVMLSGKCVNDFPSGTALDGELESGSIAVLLSNLGNIECSESTTGGKITSLLAKGLIESLTFNSCHLGGQSCTVTPQHLNYSVSVLLTTSHEEYHAVVTEDEAKGQPQALVKCGLLINCTFGSPSVLFEILLKEHDTVWDVLQELNRSGGICPNESVWHAKFLVRCLNSTHTAFEDCWPAME